MAPRKLALTRNESYGNTLQLNVSHLKAQAAAGFTTVTELADVLVREAHLPFRTAHHLVSRLVSQVIEHDLTPNDITADLLAEIAQEVLSTPLRLSSETIRRALDPVAFVGVRTTLGGAAPAATAAVLDSQASQLATDEAWLDGEQQRLAAAEHYLSEQVAELYK